MVARGVFSFLNGYCMAWVSARVLQDLRTKLFQHLISQSLEFFNRAKSGKLISRVLNDTRMAQNALTSIAGNIVKDPIAVVVGVGVLVAMDWRFSLTTLVLFPICIVPVLIFGKKVRKAGTAEENEAGTMAVILQESFAGVRVIKSFAREDYQIAQFEKSSAIQCQNSMRVRRATDIVQPLIESVSACGVVLAILYVYYFNISFMKFIALCSGIFLLYNPLKSLSRIPMLMQKCLSSTTNVFDLMELKAGDSRCQRRDGNQRVSRKDFISQCEFLLRPGRACSAECQSRNRARKAIRPRWREWRRQDDHAFADAALL